MSIDSRNKRASCLGVGLPSRVVYPNPDGILSDAGDREQMAYAYRGIAAVDYGIDGRDIVGIAMLSRTASGVALGAAAAGWVALSSRAAGGVALSGPSLAGVSLVGRATTGRGPN